MRGGAQPFGSPGRVAGIFLLVAGVHSLLAARQTKTLARRLAGPRWRDGFYRPLFNLQAVALTAWATRQFLRLPDRELYRVGPPWSWALRLVQLASLGLLFTTARAVGLARISGLAPLAAALAGRADGPEPEAQGPRLGPDGGLRVVGPFRYTRHPDNLPIPGFFFCFPRMTANRLTLALLATAYAVVGSLHEDARLRAAYGDAFERYRRHVPFFLPRPRPAWPPTATGGAG
jgi:hypothetical protein